MNNNINILFFASLREIVGHGQLAVEAGTLDQLRIALLTLLGEQVMHELHAANIRVAVNQSLVDPDVDWCNVTLGAGDEVAFLPPVTGG